MGGQSNTVSTVLVTVVLTAGLTLLVERYKRAATDRRWLLDRRHEAYVTFLEAISQLELELVRQGAGAAGKDLVLRTHALRTAWHHVWALATQEALVHAQKVVQGLDSFVAADVKGDPAANRQLFSALNVSRAELVSQIRYELQKPNPGRLWKRLRPTRPQVPPSE